MKKSLLTASAIALLASMASAQNDITVAIQLEPPNLDPTGGAAQASTVYYIQMCLKA